MYFSWLCAFRSMSNFSSHIDKTFSRMICSQSGTSISQQCTHLLGNQLHLFCWWLFSFFSFCLFQHYMFLRRTILAKNISKIQQSEPHRCSLGKDSWLICFIFHCLIFLPIHALLRNHLQCQSSKASIHCLSCFNA